MVYVANTRGEDVDVLLNALIGVVDRLTQELTTVVREVAEPIVDEAVAQPDSPAHDEPLHQVHVQQIAQDMYRRQNGEDDHRQPKTVDARVFHLVAPTAAPSKAT